MNKPSWLFWIVSILAVFWSGFSVFDFYMTKTGNEKYLQDFPPEMIGWIKDFPIWRTALWAVSVFGAFLGAVLLVMRNQLAVPVLWIGVVTMIFGFVGHDILMANGVHYYGQAGLIASCVIVVISVMIAWYASRAKSNEYLK